MCWIFQIVMFLSFIYHLSKFMHWSFNEIAVHTTCSALFWYGLHYFVLLCNISYRICLSLNLFTIFNLDKYACFSGCKGKWLCLCWPSQIYVLEIKVKTKKCYFVTSEILIAKVFRHIVIAFWAISLTLLAILRSLTRRTKTLRQFLKWDSFTSLNECTVYIQYMVHACPLFAFVTSVSLLLAWFAKA